MSGTHFLDIGSRPFKSENTCRIYNARRPPSDVVRAADGIVRGGRCARGPGAAADGVPLDVPPAGRVDAGLAGRERAGLDAREPAEAAGGGGPRRGAAGGGAGPAGRGAAAGAAAGGGGQLHGGPVAVGAAAAVRDRGGRGHGGAGAEGQQRDAVGDPGGAAHREHRLPAAGVGGEEGGLGQALHT